MSSKADKDKAKQLQDKCQSVLNGLLRDEDNKYCVDCDSKGPRWASWNIGVFLCIRCAGIHRNLGVHISKVKSVNLDSWTPEQVVSLQQMGNSRARAVYEANLPDNFRRPQSDSSLESFIRAKYEHKKYIAREWVPPTLPKVNWEKEIDDDMEKQRRKKKTIVEKKPITSVEVPQLPKPKNPSPKPTRIINSTPELKEKKGNDLLGIQNGEDSFSNFLSAPVALAKEDVKKEEGDNAKSEEESFFNQILPSEKEKVKLDKDSILALYGSAPTMPANNFNQFSNTLPQVPYQQGNFPPVAQTQNFQAFGGFPQASQTYSAQNGVQQFPAQWPSQGHWGKQTTSQFPTQNQVQYNMPNQFPPAAFQNGQFPSNFSAANTQVSVNNQFATGQQFNQPAGVSNQAPNSFFGNQSNTALQQQFGNLNLNNGPTNATPPTLATNIWQ